MKRRDRVLHVVDSLNMGGAETWLVELARYAHEHDRNLPLFDFVLTGGKPGVFDDTVRAFGSNLFYVASTRKNIGGFIKGWRRILQENRYIAIHDHQDMLSGIHFLFGLGHLPPVRVVHVHNPFYQIRNNYGVSFSRRLNQKIGLALMERFATHIFGTSARILAEYGIGDRNFKRQKVGPLNCAFDLTRFAGSHEEAKQQFCETLGWPQSTRLVLFAGRLDRSLDLDHPNNHKNSAFAVHVLSNTSTDYRMVMVGENEPVRKEFLDWLISIGMSGRVALLGVRNDLPYLMRAADVLLFPSRGEGMGMVAIEAQAAGLPVLASTAVPKEVSVLPGMVEFKDLASEFSDWATALERLSELRKTGDTINDPEWSSSSFNIKVSAERLMRVYKNQE